MGVENFIAFLITAGIFVVTPGMDTLFVLNKSIGQGRRSGVLVSLGINTGIMVHTLLGALGLSVILAQSAYGFTIVKYLGAAYILYMGITGFRSKKDIFQTSTQDLNTNRKGDFWSGFITNVFNPKVALFFMAFFPQFIIPEQISSPLPFITLGVTYAIIGILWLFTLSFFAGTFTEKIRNNPKIGLQLNKITGLIFIGMAVMVALM